jgi:hypothetical protein
MNIKLLAAAALLSIKDDSRLEEKKKIKIDSDKPIEAQGSTLETRVASVNLNLSNHTLNKRFDCSYLQESGYWDPIYDAPYLKY